MELIRQGQPLFLFYTATKVLFLVVNLFCMVRYYLEELRFPRYHRRKRWYVQIYIQNRNRLDQDLPTYKR